MIIGVRTWAIVVGVAMVLGGSCGAYVATRPPAPCRDSAEMVSPNDVGDVKCDPGASMEAVPFGSYYALVKCVCKRSP